MGFKVTEKLCNVTTPTAESRERIALKTAYQMHEMQNTIGASEDNPAVSF
jgi:hypothetical protein